MDWLLSQSNSKRRVKYIHFWGHHEAEGRITKSCLSQWYDSPFNVGGRCFATAEHWMMAEKAKLFGDVEAYEKVFLNPKPGAAKAVGREVRNFDAAIWDDEKIEIVIQGNFHKFSQSEKLKSFLLSTGNRVLVEASPVDKVWGVGLAHDDSHIENPQLWKGENLLGFALMSVREKLRHKDA